MFTETMLNNDTLVRLGINKSQIFRMHLDRSPKKDSSSTIISNGLGDAEVSEKNLECKNGMGFEKS